jgi:hypothetical protein
MTASQSSALRPCRQREHGYGFLLIILLLLFGAGLVMVQGLYTRIGARATTSGTPDQTLIEAKMALLGYALIDGNGGAGNRLGSLPAPDVVNASGNSIFYDGKGDGDKCLGVSSDGLPAVTVGSIRVKNQRCLGRFPWIDLGLKIDSTLSNDPGGVIPWLAVSGNLHNSDKCLSKLNSEVLNWSADPGTQCPLTSASLPYPWMTVVDKEGKVLSSRVAAILIMPGAPVRTRGRMQDRSAAYPHPREYLDAIALPLGCISACLGTFDNAGLSNVFVQIAPGTRYPANSEDSSKSGQLVEFNDELIYITIDELMPYIERRVLSEMASALKSSQVRNQSYPWAAAFSSVTDATKFVSVPGTTFGFFPFQNRSIPGNFQSDFAWEAPDETPPSKSCVLAKSAPARYIDARERLRADYFGSSGAAGTASGQGATCQWNGIPSNSQRKLSCYFNETGATQLASFTLYSNSSCSTVASGSPTQLPVRRTTAITIEPICSSNKLQVTFKPADASNVQRFDYLCAKVSSSTGSVFTVGIEDAVSIPASSNPVLATLSVNAVNKSANVRGMRIEPQMPNWFYENDWYLTAFLALSPAVAPSAVMPCGTTQYMSLGNQINVPAIVLLAGARLPTLPGIATQSRPSNQLSDYLEAPNLNGPSSCMFAPIDATDTKTYNDQILVISPEPS